MRFLLLLRRRSCSGPLLLLLGAAICLFYQKCLDNMDQDKLKLKQLTPASRPGPEEEEEARRVITALDHYNRQARSGPPLPPHTAVVLTGRLPVTHTEVQLYQRVLQKLGYHVHTSTYTETSSHIRNSHGVSGWSVLLCLSSAERSCLRRINFNQLEKHHMVNLLPSLLESFSDAGEGLCHFLSRSGPALSALPIMHHSCGPANHKPPFPLDSEPPVAAPPPLVAMVNVYVVVTSLKPMTSFLHDIIVVTTNQEQRGRATKLSHFLVGPAFSHDALQRVKRVIGAVLQAAVSSNQKPRSPNRCVLCFQLLTFTLMFSGSDSPVVIQVDADLEFSALSDQMFERQITKERILEDALMLLLPTHTHTQTHTETHTHLTHTQTHTHTHTHTQTHKETHTQYGGCLGTFCPSDEEFLLLLRFHQQLKSPSAFSLLSPSSSSSNISDLMMKISRFYQTQNRTDEEKPTNQEAAESLCVEPLLRQLYTSPPLSLAPPFHPRVTTYHADVSFDTVTVTIRPVTMNPMCSVHLDQRGGPSIANFPLGLGHSRINILVTRGKGEGPDDIIRKGEEPDEVTRKYTVHVHRESRPSLPMFGDHVTCSFIQDCGLVVRPDRPCGLQPFISSHTHTQTCSSGAQPGRWLVPCLTCSDNRTCDWREVSWRPDDCYHATVERPLLQACMKDRKVLFIGDSTNRGMMYFLAERVNSSLLQWKKNHDVLVHKHLNSNRTSVSFSYYPQFWLTQRPGFRQALTELLDRSRPLVNSNLTVLVVGGVQWLNTQHLKTIRDALKREALDNIVVVVKSLGMGFHLPVDGIRSLTLTEVQALYQQNRDIISTAMHYGYEVIDTFSITMGRHKEFLQGRCACHYHEVERFQSNPLDDTMTNRSSSNQSEEPHADQRAGLKPASAYHVRGPVNQVYSEILLSRLCPQTRN